MLSNFSLFLPLLATLGIPLPAPSSSASRTRPAPLSLGLALPVPLHHLAFQMLVHSAVVGKIMWSTPVGSLDFLANTITHSIYLDTAGVNLSLDFSLKLMFPCFQFTGYAWRAWSDRKRWIHRNHGNISFKALIWVITQRLSPKTGFASQVK